METNNINPRAKIGDVVIVKLDFYILPIRQLVVVEAYLEEEWKYFLEEGKNDGRVRCSDKDILKNLTTNVSYE